MAIKKSDLYSSLWQSCDELRGGMDASQYKDYVLVLLFIKYISDKYADKPDALIEVPKGASFSDLIKFAGKKEVGEETNKIVQKIFEANGLTGIEVADFDDEEKLGKGKELVERVSNLIQIFNDPNLDFKGNRAEDDDLLGDAYEYLMRHFATESGKSKGQFYTPAEVSRIMAQVLGITKATSNNQTIYDPTCGSGSLLLKAHDEAKHATGYDLALYGQEKDNATTSLAKMNMILHDCPTAVHDVVQGNTLASPEHTESDNQLKTFDFIVANPPFSDKKWQNGLLGDDSKFEDKFNRFEIGVPPAKNGDYAYLLHLLKSLKSTGKGVIVLPHGVLFRGNVEAQIRESLVKRGYIKGIIGLPANLFYGTGIPACLVVIDKEHAKSRKGIFIIDASRGFVKDGNKNRLREQDIRKIVDVFNSHDETNPKYARLVSLGEIEKNEYNLNIPRYIDSTEPEDVQDIEAHLLGGMPNNDIDALSEYWEVFPNLKTTLFEDGKRPNYSNLKVAQDEIRQSIFEHPEFVSYSNEVREIFRNWKSKNLDSLANIKIGDKPREVLAPLSESVLEIYANKKLINQYDVYQHFMSYWLSVMKDDVYMLVEEGWKAEVKEIVKEKGKKNKKIDGTIKIGKKEFICELIPKELIVKNYFQDKWEEIQTLESEKDALIAEKEEILEENSGDEGVLEDIKNDKGNITKKDLDARIKEIKQSKSSEFDDELKILKAYSALNDKEAKLSKSIKSKTEELEKLMLKKYTELSESEIKDLVINKKWFADVELKVQSEIDKILQTLFERTSELESRYKFTLPKLTDKVSKLSSKVETHLTNMGYSWQ